MVTRCAWTCVVTLLCGCEVQEVIHSPGDSRPAPARLKTFVARWPRLHSWDSPEPFRRVVSSVAYELGVSRNSHMQGAAQRTLVLAGRVVIKGLVDAEEPPTDIPGVSSERPYGVAIMGEQGLSAPMSEATLMKPGDRIAVYLESGDCVRREVVGLRRHDIPPRNAVVRSRADEVFHIVALEERLYVVCVRDCWGDDGARYRSGSLINAIDRRGPGSLVRIGAREGVERRLASAESRRRIRSGLVRRQLDPLLVVWDYLSACGVVCEENPAGAIDLGDGLLFRVSGNDGAVVRGDESVELPAGSWFHTDASSVGLFGGRVIVLQSQSSRARHVQIGDR